MLGRGEGEVGAALFLQAAMTLVEVHSLMASGKGLSTEDFISGCKLITNSL